MGMKIGNGQAYSQIFEWEWKIIVSTYLGKESTKETWGQEFWLMPTADLMLLVAFGLPILVQLPKVKWYTK